MRTGSYTNNVLANKRARTRFKYLGNKREYVIDLVLTTHSSRILLSVVTNIGISDHELTGVSRRMHCVKYKPSKVVHRDYFIPTTT